MLGGWTGLQLVPSSISSISHIVNECSEFERSDTLAQSETRFEVKDSIFGTACVIRMFGASKPDHISCVTYTYMHRALVRPLVGQILAPKGDRRDPSPWDQVVETKPACAVPQVRVYIKWEEMNGLVSRVGILIAFSFGPENLLSKTGGMREYHSGPRLMHFVLHWIPD